MRLQDSRNWLEYTDALDRRVYLALPSIPLANFGNSITSDRNLLFHMDYQLKIYNINSVVFEVILERVVFSPRLVWAQLSEVKQH